MFSLLSCHSHCHFLSGLAFGRHPHGNTGARVSVAGHAGLGGPPVTAGQTIGSVTSITAVTFGLWSLKVPFNFNPLSALLAMTTAWAAIVYFFLYLTGTPAVVMSFAIAANAAFIFVRHRNFRPALEKTHGKPESHAAIPTIIFLLVFFFTAQIAPEFVRGVLVMFPIGLLATIYYVSRATSRGGFQNFIVYTHGGILHCNIRRRGPLFARTDVDCACTCPQSPPSRCRKFCS